MDWANERYVRFYTRDTPEWTLMSWEARSLFGLLLRVVDRAGVIELGKAGPKALASLLRAPAEVVTRALEEWTTNGCVELRGSTLVIPKFMDAQEARQSDKTRQAESRARRRDAARFQEVARDATESVTRSHTASHDVTPSRAVPCLAVPPNTAPSVLTATDAPSKREEAFALAPTKPERKPRALSAAELCFARCEDARMAAFPGSPRRGLTGNQVARWNGFYRDKLAELGGDEARFLAVVGAYLLDPWARGCDPPCPWAGLTAPEVWERCLHRATQATPAATGDPCAVDSCPSPRGERTAGKPLCRGHYAEWQGAWMREGSPGATADGDFGAEHLEQWLTNMTGAPRAQEAV